MDRLFLDANVLFSAAYKSDSGIRRLWKLDGVVLYSSRYALEEARFNLAEENSQRRLLRLAQRLQVCEAVERSLPVGVSLPDKDVPILLAAIEARVNFLLTGDFRHFGPYFGRKFEGVTIMTPSRYFKLRVK